MICGLASDSRAGGPSAPLGALRLTPRGYLDTGDGQKAADEQKAGDGQKVVPW